jgi:Arc/MetJ family transcription regulator
MRTTIILKDDLVKKASSATGITEKTALIHKGLEALIERAAVERLIKLGGSAPRIKTSPRRRSRR